MTRGAAAGGPSKDEEGMVLLGNGATFRLVAKPRPGVSRGSVEGPICFLFQDDGRLGLQASLS